MPASKEAIRRARRKYEAKPEVKAKKQRARYAKTKAWRATPEGKAQRAAEHKRRQATDPTYGQKRNAANKARRARPEVRERLNFLKRYNRSGLPLELFQIQDLTRQLKTKINELRRPKKDALCRAPKA